MAKLTDRQKAHVVASLAAYHSPSEVRDELKKIFGLELGLDQVVYYDPTTANGAKLAQKWKDLFDETRARCNTELEGIPIAIKAYRLRRLQRILESTLSPVVQMSALEQAAKEVGDAYTNTQRLRHTGKDDDSPIQHEHAVVITIPDNGRGDRALGAINAAGALVDMDGELGYGPRDRAPARHVSVETSRA